MQIFVNYIVQFVRSIYESINNAIYHDFFYVYDSYRAFLDKNVFLDSSFIGFNLTYFDLLTHVFLWVLVLTIIILFIKFLCKILSIFRVG